MQCNDCGRCGNLKELFFYPYIKVYGEDYKQLKGWYKFSEKFSIQCPALVRNQNIFSVDKHNKFGIIFYIPPFNREWFATSQECFDYLLNDDRINLEETLHIMKLQSKLKGA